MLVQKRMPAAQRRRQLIHVAIETFATEGFHSTAMNTVAEAAGITKPVLYQHFKSKHDLFLALLQDISDRLWDHVSQTALTSSNPREQAQAGVAAVFSFFRTHPSAFRVFFGDGTHSEPEFSAAVAEIEMRLAANVATAIHRDDLDYDDRVLLAHGVVGMIVNACRHLLRTGADDDEVERGAALVAELSWAGLRGMRPVTP